MERELVISHPGLPLQVSPSIRLPAVAGRGGGTWFQLMSRQESKQIADEAGTVPC